MSYINDGSGPAFPSVETHPVMGSRSELGMTLRDYFAAKAMAAMLTIEDVHLNYGESQWARWAYEQADAMLRQRMVPVDSSNESA